MDSVLRGAIIYLVLFVIFRVAGNRTLAQTTSFDLILLIIISQTIQDAILDSDHSLTNGFLLIITLVGLTLIFSHGHEWSATFKRWVNGVPILIYDRGRFLEDRMHRARVDKEEILEAARMRQGLRSMDEVDYAILEPNGEITVIPKRA